MVYLSLGSNMGNRLEYLQLAIGIIAYRVGPIKSISAVYETPAWGFESNPFLNLCLGLSTDLPPEKLLDELLEIEQQLGRKRNSQNGYSARTIDLDILLYDNWICSTPKITLPHPRMHQRRFILGPLCDIAKNQFHPTLQQSILTLEKACKDPAVLDQLPIQLKSPRVFSFMAIEGIIGVGKTTLAKKIQALLGGTLLLENFLDNPYLADFYTDPTGFALRVETAFLNQRMEHYRHFFSEQKTKPILADFMLEKSLLFAKVNLPAADFESYILEFIRQRKGLPQPEVVLVLTQNPAGALKKIKRRGRAIEKNISLDYLEKLNAAYAQLEVSSSVTRIDYPMEEVDFVQDSNAFYALLLRLFSA